MRRNLVRLRLAALLAALPLLVSACENPFITDARDELADARSRWARNGRSSYAYTVARSCFCGDIGPMRVSVLEGVVVSRVYTETGQPVPADRHTDLDTVEELFELLEDALDEDPADFEASYDGLFGYPASAFIDYSANVADEEDGFVVTDFTILTLES
jgi:uncharacterized protein DUF6174